MRFAVVSGWILVQIFTYGGTAFAQQGGPASGASPTGGGLEPSNEEVGGGLETSRGTSGMSGGGLNPVDQNQNPGNGQGQVAPSGQSYRALGISGY